MKHNVKAMVLELKQSEEDVRRNFQDWRRRRDKRKTWKRERRGCLQEAESGLVWPLQTLKCVARMTTCPGFSGAEGFSREAGLSMLNLSKSWENQDELTLVLRGL